MTKAQLKTQIESKKGFHSIIADEISPDNVQGDPIEKRYFYVNHTNADGTMGKTFMYYLHDTANDVATFFNDEIEALDAREATANEKKIQALTNYLKANFNAYFVIRIDTTNNWAEADVFKLSSGNLVASKVMVFKTGNNPISHLNIV